MRNFDNSKLTMRIKLLVAIFLSVLPLTFLAGQNDKSDSILLQERAYYFRKYKSVRDTMTINSWLNLKRVSDNLEQVVKRDQQVIDFLRVKISSDSTIIATLTDISTQNNILPTHKEVKIKNGWVDDFPASYLIAFVGFLFLFVLILIYFLIARYNKFKRYRSSSDHYESIAEERLHQIEQLDLDLRKMKQRELDFREELERGMQSNQERLLLLQEKCEQLEVENQKLTGNKTTPFVTHPASSSEGFTGADLPDNPDELKGMIKSLYNERNSLLNLAGKLRAQLDGESRKNHEIYERINLLMKDLSENKVQ